MKKIAILKSIVNWLIKKLLYPFNNDLPYFLLLFTVNSCVCCGIILIKGTFSFFVSLILFYFAATYLLVFLSNLNKYVSYIVKPLLLIISVIFLVSNIYCICKYQSRMPLHVIFGTNINEICEYIEVYSSLSVIFLLTASIVLFCIIIYVLINRLKIKTSAPVYTSAFILAIMSFITTICHPEIVSHILDKNGVSLSQLVDVSKYPTYPHIESRVVKMPDNIIVILGESFTSSHSSLYGYTKETNPLLKQKLDNGNLFVFNQVTAPKTSTTAAFTYLLNTYRIGMEQEQKWYKSTNLIEVMKTAGYHTIWLSNQESSGRWANIALSYAKICDASMFTQNKLTWGKGDDGVWRKHDDVLLNYKLSELGGAKEEHNIIFYHLLGQHVNFRERYPEEYDIFLPSDYNIGVYQNKILAQYDNATLFNDFVVSSIMDLYKEKDAVVFYFSDHGLDIFDTDPEYFGHAKNTPESQAVGKMIPFMVYLSPIYQQLRPELTEKIRNATKKEFCTDKLIYAVMDAAGLKFTNNNDVEKYSPF